MVEVTEKYYANVDAWWRDNESNVSWHPDEADNIDEKALFKTRQSLMDYLGTSSKSGLTTEQARKNLELFGSNRPAEIETSSFLELCWDLLQDITLIILLVAAAIELALGLGIEHMRQEGGWIEGVAIIGTVAVVVLVGASNDYQKEKQFQALKKQTASERKSTVIRDGSDKTIPNDDVVVGDIVYFSSGDELPCDGVLISGSNVKMDESKITGETLPVKKDVNNNPKLAGKTSNCESTGAKFIACRVGAHSQAGQLDAIIAKSKKDDDKGILTEKLEDIATLIFKIGFAAALLVAFALWIRFIVFLSQAEDCDLPVIEGNETGSEYVTDTDHRRALVGGSSECEPREKWEWKSEYLVDRILNGVIVGVVVLVVAVPEGLPLAVTIALAFSVKKMLADQNLVRQLTKCEVMGTATTICSDKTGTLTKNEMTVTRGFIPQGKSQRYDFEDKADNQTIAEKNATELNSEEMDVLFKNLIQNSSAKVIQEGKEIAANPDDRELWEGNATEIALLKFARKIKGAKHCNWSAERGLLPGTNDADPNFHQIPFNSARKRMVTIIEEGGKWLVLVKGASDMVNDSCVSVNSSIDGSLDFSKMRSEVDGEVKDMADNALRTISIGYKEMNPDPSIDFDSIEDEQFEILCSELTFLGVVGIKDPLRPEVKRAIELCETAQITVRMVTGDHIQTAKAIAADCKIFDPAKGHIAMTGKEFRSHLIPNPNPKKDDDDKEIIDPVWFLQVYENFRVMARAMPDDKYHLVKAVMDVPGEVCAVTGDGSNDGPALAKANVGFAMGIAGTDVAKNACDIQILDDNFNSIVKAVMWGRNVYDSVQKFLQFQITVNIVAITTATIGSAVLGGCPLTAVQMLWVNMIMDTLASLALATESPRESVLERPPAKESSSILSKIMWRNVLGQSLYQIIVIAIWIFAAEKFIKHDGKEDSCTHDSEYICNGRDDVRTSSIQMTMVFNIFVWMQWFNQFNARKIASEANVFEGVFGSIDDDGKKTGVNWLFWVVMALEGGSQAIIVEFTGKVFHVRPLSGVQWAWCLGISAISLPVYQIVRLIPENIIPDWVIGAGGAGGDEEEQVQNKVTENINPTRQTSETPPRGFQDPKYAKRRTESIDQMRSNAQKNWKLVRNRRHVIKAASMFSATEKFQGPGFLSREDLWKQSTNQRP